MSKGLGIIRRCKALVLAAGLIAAIAPATASAADFTVNDDVVGGGPPGANCGAAPFTTIPAAVTAAAGNAEADRVLVCAGVYAAPVTISESLQLLGPKVGVDARTRSTTGEAILDMSASTLTLNAAVTVDGFRFLGGDTALVPAIAANVNVAKIVQNNIFDQNQVGLSGVFGSNSVFRQNLVTGTVSRGVKIDTASQTGVQIINNTFLNGGTEEIVLEGTATVAMNNTVISGNARSGGANNFALLFNSDGTTVTGNTISGGGGAGAGGVFIAGGSAGTTVTGNAFTGGASAVELSDFQAPPLGPNSLTTVTGNTMLNNTNAVVLRGDPGSSDAVQVHFNRFRGNTQAIRTEVLSAGGSVDATNNWFGCNAGPGAVGCDTTVTAPVTGAPITTTPWLVLALSANPASFKLSGSSALSASLQGNSAGAQVGPGFPNGTGVAFATDLGTIAPIAATSGGVATSTLTSNKLGKANVTSTLDSQTVGTTATATKKCKKKAKKGAATAKKKKCKKKKKKK